MFAPRRKNLLQDPQATLRRLRDWATRRATPSPPEDVLASIWKSRLAIDDAQPAVGPSTSPQGVGLDDDLVPVLGEFAWHSLTVDPRIAEVSKDHYATTAAVLEENARAAREPRVLEIAAYAHTTGYMLHQRRGARTDLLDISPSTLRLGRRLAREQGLGTEGTRCIAGDFHDLPYDDDQFDLVYICSALHHTWRWERVLSEMVRVLAPGGVLLLENEPCRRLFCHYRFRTNRPDSFGELERALDRTGILRTIAEPYPGTRPETLFGMVENQTIPIGALCARLAASCVPISVRLSPEVCMGPLEQELVARSNDGMDACTSWLKAEMKSRVDEARSAMTAADIGMGFGLPSADEIDALCGTAMQALIDLPVDRRSPDFRFGLANIFGASVQLTVRKKGTRRAPAAARLRQNYPTLNEVVIAFPSRVAQLLDPHGALLPDIQSAPAETLNRVFPPTDWRVGTTPNGLRDLSPAVARPCLVIPVPKPGPLLVLVRLYVAFEGRPYRIALRDDTGEVAGFDAFRADSLLLSPVISCAEGASSLRLTIRTSALDAAGAEECDCNFTVSYAGAFSLQQSSP
ncbi:MAG TPA: class I SAM-dependent methyltransferase [Burkholderiales bacterium]|nr:class I SAM-dependent methyltransferase [Burkholderiales bacterium]